MKKLIKVMAVALVALSVVFCFTACSKKIVGSWEGKMEGVKVIYNFEKDGKGSIDAGAAKMGFEYEVDGDTLTIKLENDNETDKAKFEISGDELTITDSDNDEKITLTKVKK